MVQMKVIFDTLEHLRGAHVCRTIPAILAATVLTIAVSHDAIADNGSIIFPASAADLADGSHWNISTDSAGHPPARDIVVARDSGQNNWVDTVPVGGSANKDRLGFGIPLYAPANGEVVSCWRNHPENPNPGTSRPERCCNGNCDISCDNEKCPSTVACKITRSGNHVAIRKQNGDVILVAHLQSGSIPSNVCPHNAEFMQNSKNRRGDYPEESFLEAGDRPAVRQGQFIGRAGNSGASSRPHLHIHTPPTNEQPDGALEGDLVPTLVSYAWVRDRASGAPWRKLTADALANPPILVHASPFLRRDADDGGSFSEVTMDGSVAAFRNSEGNLQIIVYLVNSQGKLTRGQVVDAGKASELNNHQLKLVG